MSSLVAVRCQSSAEQFVLLAGFLGGGIKWRYWPKCWWFLNMKPHSASVKRSSRVPCKEGGIDDFMRDERDEKKKQQNGKLWCALCRLHHTFIQKLAKRGYLLEVLMAGGRGRVGLALPPHTVWGTVSSVNLPYLGWGAWCGYWPVVTTPGLIIISSLQCCQRVVLERKKTGDKENRRWSKNPTRWINEERVMKR